MLISICVCVCVEKQMSIDNAAKKLILQFNGIVQVKLQKFLSAGQRVSLVIKKRLYLFFPSSIPPQPFQSYYMVTLNEVAICPQSFVILLLEKLKAIRSFIHPRILR